MARQHRIVAIVVLVSLAGIAAVAVGGVLVALGREQPFYTAALEADPVVLASASRELESRATAFYSETRQPGEWQAAFTEDQINGWLAVRLANLYAEDLPESFSEPRVAIDDGELALAFRTRRAGVDTVVTAKASAMLTDDGNIAIRLRSVHAGALPIPAMQVAEEISQACRQLELPVSWTQIEGQPVAIVEINRGGAARHTTIALDSLEIEQGAIYVAGRTLPAADGAGR
jgi:uncharacterized protein YpmS